MTFDFQEQFKHSPTIELLEILHHPENYQPAAVDAASAILKERQVTVTALEQAKNAFDENDVNGQSKKERTVDDGETSYLLDSILQPQHNARPAKWPVVLLVILAVPYLWILYVRGTHVLIFFRYVLECKSNGFDTSNEPVTIFSCIASVMSSQLVMNIFSVVYIPAIFYLVYKRRKWGWILLFVDNMFAVISQLGQWYFYLKYQDNHEESFLLAFFLPTLIRAAFVYFLWRNEVTIFFPLSEETKKKVAIATALISFAFIGVLIMISR